MHFMSIKRTFLSLCVNLERTAKANICCCYTPIKFIVETEKGIHGRMSWEVLVNIFKILHSEKIRKDIFECNWFPKTFKLLFLLNSTVKPTLITTVQDQHVLLKGLMQALLWGVHCFEQETPGDIFQYKSKRKELSSPHLTPMVNMLRRCFPCNQPMSIIKPGGGKASNEKHWSKYISPICFSCTWRRNYTTKPSDLSFPGISAYTSQNPSNPHQVLLKAAALEHRGLSQLHAQLWALRSTHQLCQRKKGWVASPVCPCFFGEAFWESGNMREKLFYFVRYERWEDEGKAEW